jgi:rsbT co-antagonist protein RsbR
MPSTAELEAEVAALRAENLALRQARDSHQHLLRAIADYAPLVLYAKDLAGRFVLTNRLHAALLGRTPAEVVGATEAELLGEEVAAEIEAVVAEVLRTGAPHVAEFTIPLDGARRVFLEHVFPLAGDGSPEGIGGAAIDITERKRAEDDVRVFAALAEHAPDGILVRPADPLAPMIANPSLRRILGLPADATAEQASIRLHRAGALELLRDDGETVSLVVSSFEIPGADGACMATATIVRDVTTLQRAIREREAQAEQHRRQQAAQIVELSAPILPLAPGVLVMPLIGALDEGRSAHVTEAVLEAIVRHQARALIVDLTGLRAVDVDAADRIARLVGAVGMLGARVVVTGIRPAVAAVLVELGFEAQRGVVVLATLADAVAATLARR